jgi:hypothetical protein
VNPFTLSTRTSEAPVTTVLCGLLEDLMTPEAASFLLMLCSAGVLGFSFALRGVRRSRTRVRLLKSMLRDRSLTSM